MTQTASLRTPSRTSAHFLIRHTGWSLSPPLETRCNNNVNSAILPCSSGRAGGAQRDLADSCRNAAQDASFIRFRLRRSRYSGYLELPVQARGARLQEHVRRMLSRGASQGNFDVG